MRCRQFDAIARQFQKGCSRRAAAVSGPLMPLTASVLRSMLGSDVAASVAAPTIVTDRLFPEERRHISRTAEKRRAEFGTARLCARHALAQLGVAPCSLVPYPDRSPRWPQGICGTISHTKGCCAVAVASVRHFAGLGLDVEMDTALERRLESAICTDQECAWLDRFSDADRGRLGKLLFCAKEAFYKCQYATTQALIGFHDVEIEIDLDTGTFLVIGLRWSGGEWDFVRRIKGQFRREAGLLFATATLTSKSQTL
jgi:4'-phosphopantetheinyl transferase EntD